METKRLHRRGEFALNRTALSHLLRCSIDLVPHDHVDVDRLVITFRLLPTISKSDRLTD